jgi:hypothetical protein
MKEGKTPESESDSERPEQVISGTTNRAIPLPSPERPRIDFGALTRLAASGGGGQSRPAVVPKEENSGVIDLQAIAASAIERRSASLAPKPFAPGVTSSATRSTPEAPSNTRVHDNRRRTAAWLVLTGAIAASAAVAGVYCGMSRTAAHEADSRAGAAPSLSTERGPSPSAPFAGPGPSAHPGSDATSLLPKSSEEGPAASARGAPPSVPSPTPNARPVVAAQGPKIARAANDRSVLGSSSTNPPDDDSNLQVLMRRAVGVPSSGSAASAPSSFSSPEESTGSAPLKPVLGAVQGAVGTALPAARACLGPDDPIARATLTFRSDGTVEDVAVAGDSTARQAEACIRKALLAARLPPFRAPTFTWTATVRPP